MAKTLNELQKVVEENKDIVSEIMQAARDRWTTYWWGITDEDSDMCGEEFFTELKNATRKDHEEYVKKVFPNENLTCYGKVSAAEAEMMGLDTY